MKTQDQYLYYASIDCFGGVFWALLESISLIVLSIPMHIVGIFFLYILMYANKSVGASDALWIVSTGTLGDSTQTIRVFARISSVLSGYQRTPFSFYFTDFALLDKVIPAVQFDEQPYEKVEN